MPPPDHVAKRRGDQGAERHGDGEQRGGRDAARLARRSAVTRIDGTSQPARIWGREYSGCEQQRAGHQDGCCCCTRISTKEFRLLLSWVQNVMEHIDMILVIGTVTEPGELNFSGKKKKNKKQVDRDSSITDIGDGEDTLDDQIGEGEEGEVCAGDAPKYPWEETD